MPLVGTRDVGEVAAGLPPMPGFATEPWELTGVSILQLIFEMNESSMLELLPPALHPTIPPVLIFATTHVPDSSVGPFTLAEVRVGCRAAARPRAFLARCYCDSEKGAHELRTRWGYPVEVGNATLVRAYDRISASVVAGGRTILSCSLVNPEPIGGGDVQYLPNMNLARSRRDGEVITRLVQVDPDFVIQKADRGRPVIDTFEPAPWLVGGAKPVWPVSASLVLADVTMPRLRYLMVPSKPPLEAVERV